VLNEAHMAMIARHGLDNGQRKDWQVMSRRDVLKKVSDVCCVCVCAVFVY
jgi:hypothetical protein